MDMIKVLTIKIKTYLHKVVDYLVTIISTIKYKLKSRNPRVFVMMMMMMMRLIAVGINLSVHNFWIKKYEICYILSDFTIRAYIYLFYMHIYYIVRSIYHIT